MAELTQGQIKRASEAFRAAKGGSSGLLAAAPFLQLPDVKDYTDELIAAVIAVSGSGDPKHSCWCNDFTKFYRFTHSAKCRRLRKLIKEAKARRV